MAEQTPRERLMSRLMELAGCGDVEVAHCEADRAILEFIDDPAITEAFEAVPKWYA